MSDIPMPDNPILIAGAGIGGLTLALALSRIGRTTITIEQRTRVEEIGAGIQLSPNASRVLIGLGLGHALAKVAAEPRKLTIRSAKSGQTLSTMPLGETMRSRYGAPYLTIHRADLQTILLDAVRGTDGARLAFGRSVAGFAENRSHGIDIDCVSTATRETVSGQALVGADGLWSTIAEQLGDQSKPEFRRHIAWRGLVARQDWPKELPFDETGLWLGPGAHLVHYPIRRGEMINLVAVTSDPENEPGWSRRGDADKIAKRMASWHPSAQKAIAAVGDWTIWSLYDRPPRKQWSHNRVTLLGDAAHPVLPFLAQGGALAIEDAAVLVNEMVHSPADPAAAFLRYETRRRPRAARVQAAARQNGSLFHLSWPFSVARDFTMQRTNISDRYDWLYGWSID
jgi:salicylate hydroxylase